MKGHGQKFTRKMHHAVIALATTQTPSVLPSLPSMADLPFRWSHVVWRGPRQTKRPVGKSPPAPEKSNCYRLPHGLHAEPQNPTLENS